jgi:17beta-estradiol 17-dehydrogenase / very-long-chain 3-oxoacyl-CoA reductase
MTRKVDLRKKYGGEGCWAVVTGGTDGIGLGFVEVLVEDGWNVCIVSRNE